jgi:organic radical activating enzyme
MLAIPYLEVPITHVCNLHCDGCCYYSNYNIKTMVSADEVRDTVSAWAKRIKPGMVKILGGEPLVNRQLPEIFLTLRQLFPECHLQVITNGLQLEKCPILPHLLTAPNTSLSLSIHSNDDAYIAKLQDSINTINGWVAKFGIRAISSDNRVGWKRHHTGLGQFMQPFADGDFKASWRVCPAKECVVLFDRRLWKCPQTASLHLAAEKFSLEANAAWAPYLAYKGVDVNCTDAELHAHLKGGAEPVCGMCPVNPESYEKDIYNADYGIPDVMRVERGGTIVRTVDAASPVVADSRIYVSQAADAPA